MKRYLCAVSLAVLTLLPSCKGKEETKTYTTPGGTVKVTEQAGRDVREFTMKTKEGTATLKMGEGVMPEDIGVPLYPGATAEEGGTWSMSGQAGGGTEGMSSALLHTSDGLDKVVAFYRDKLAGRNPTTFEMGTAEGQMVSFALEEGEGTSTTILVMSSPDEPGTRIQISKVSR